MAEATEVNIRQLAKGIFQKVDGLFSKKTEVQELKDSVDSSVKELKDSLLDKTYPVGSIYMSMNETNPGTLFGGTWEQLEGRFLLGMGFAGTTNSDDHFAKETGLSAWKPAQAGETGGEAWHKLTVNEMPSHEHNVTLTYSFTDKSGSGWSHRVTNGDSTSWSLAGKAKASSVGGNSIHNNMPPYLAVYMWKRTA